MPKKTYRRRYRKSTRRGKSRRFKKQLRRGKIPKPLVCPNQTLVHLRYIELTTMYLGNAGGTTNFINYKLNDAYDVSANLATTTMPGFNEWSYFYSKYKVMATRIKVEFTNTTTNPIYAGIYLNPANTTIGTWANFMETRGNRFSTQTLMAPGSNTGSTVKLKMFARLKKLLGDSEFKNDINYAALVSTGPTIVLLGTVYIASYDGVTFLPAIVPMKAEVDMWVKFYDRKIVFN